MTPFIITLGTLGVARGSAKWLADNETVNYDFSPINRWMMTVNPFSLTLLPAGVWVTIVPRHGHLRSSCAARCSAGMSSRSAPTRPPARLCVPVTRLKILTYALGGAFFGLARLKATFAPAPGGPDRGDGPGTRHHRGRGHRRGQLNGGTGGVMGSMIGALIMSVLRRNGSQQMGWPTYFQEIIIGLVIIVAVFLDRLRQNRAA